MTDEQRPEPADSSPSPGYHQVVTAHMLHRIWELLGVIAMLVADDDDKRRHVQQVMDKQQDGDYDMPFRW